MSEEDPIPVKDSEEENENVGNLTESSGDDDNSAPKYKGDPNPIQIWICPETRILYIHLHTSKMR